MDEVRKYLAEIGRRGGRRSRRVLDPETAREMVRIREARRAARRLNPAWPEPARDTRPDADRVRLAAIRRMEPVRRLRAALDLSESVRSLALGGLRVIHPGRNDLELVELMLGRSLVPGGSAGRA